MAFEDLFKSATQPAPLTKAHVLGALSHALDLTEGQPPGHCQRATWIGVHIGRALGLGRDELAALYYAILLKDLGCSSNAARIAELYCTDDLHFKRSAKYLGDERHSALRFILDHSAPGEGLMTRVRTVLSTVRHAEPIVQHLIETRCERGAAIARQLRFPEGVAAGIFHLDEHWDGSGRPHGLRGNAIPLFSRIALLAQVVDVFHADAGPLAACDAVVARTDTWFDPEVACALHEVARSRHFWATLASPGMDRAVQEMQPAETAIKVDDAYLDDIANAFAQVIDAKSPFTSGHSSRVALFADRIAEQMDLHPDTRRHMRRAALLHDVGKLGVSNRILDKPGKLDLAEWQAMRQHPVFSERILSRVPAFREMAEIGGAHHERLDGGGYPRGLEAERIGRATRIVSVADVCDALTADRPYRAAMAPDRMLAIMAGDVGTAFDADCYQALRELTLTERLLEPALPEPSSCPA